MTEFVLKYLTFDFRHRLNVRTHANTRLSSKARSKTSRFSSLWPLLFTNSEDSVVNFLCIFISCHSNRVSIINETVKRNS